MAGSEKAEIENLKKMLEGVLEEQARQINGLQDRMEKDGKYSKELKDQLTKEREGWKDKEKQFQSRIRSLEKEVADMKSIIKLQGNNLVIKLNKDVEQKQRLIASLMSSLDNERSKSRDLEQKFKEQRNKMSPGETKSKQNGAGVATSAHETDSKIETVDASTLTEESIESEAEAQISLDSHFDSLNETVFELVEVKRNSTENSSDVEIEEPLETSFNECVNCKEVLNDRVILSCHHMYCLECLKELLEPKDKESLLCGECRVPFTLSPILKQNFSFSQLKMSLAAKRQLMKLALRSKACGVCSSEQLNNRYAEFVCMLCSSKTCNECVMLHARESKENSLHLILAIEEPILQNKWLEINDICDEHEGKSFDMYCENCECLLCNDCSESHRDHTTASINNYGEKAKAEIQRNFEGFDDVVSSLSGLSKQFGNLLERNGQKKERMKSEIGSNSFMIKLWVDVLVTALERELDFLSEVNTSYITSEEKALRICLEELECFRLYNAEFSDLAETKHLACFGDNVNKRVVELVESGNGILQHLTDAGFAQRTILKSLTDDRFPQKDRLRNPVTIKFHPEFLQTEMSMENIVGKLEVSSIKGFKPRIIRVNPRPESIIKSESDDNAEKEVCGLTSLNDELFVAFRGSSTIQIYNLSNFQLKRQIPEMRNISDLSSCTQSNRLFIYGLVEDTQGVIVLNVIENTSESWEVPYDAGRLSVTHDGVGVVVTGCNTNKFSEYTTDGYLILEITLNPDTGIFHLWHAIKALDKHFIISHGIASDATHGVCVIDIAGNVLRRFKGDGSRLDTPVYMTFGQDVGILVADLNNMRVVQLNTILEFNGEVLSRKDELKWPCRIHFDSENNRLFVANGAFLEHWEIRVFSVE